MGGLATTNYLMWCSGDSLLFAAGAFAALGSLHLGAVCAVFISAAIIGDAVNYAIGNYLGVSFPFQTSNLSETQDARLHMQDNLKSS